MTGNAQIPGAPKWGAKMPMIVGYLAVIILVIGFGGWSVLTTISGAIIAPGQIEVEQNRQIVQHPDGGVVGELFVAEGETVAAGDIVLRLDDTALQSELAVIESQYYELVARRGRLEAERDDLAEISFDPVVVAAAATDAVVRDLTEGQSRLFEARLASLKREADQLAERKVQIAAQITGLEAQFAAQTKQLELIKGELDDQKKLLEKGLAQASRVSALQREEARLEGALGNILKAHLAISLPHGRKVPAG